MENRKKLNEGWEFAKFSIDQGSGEIEKGYTGWSSVKLPHDWQIFDPADLYENAEGWYRRRLTLDLKEQERILIYFEGVYMETTLYVNGSSAGEWKYGYSSFYFDITKYVHSGENEILVKTVYRNPNTRWYSGAGIYRDVWLYQVPETYFTPDGVYLSAECVQGYYEKETLQRHIEAGETELPAESGSWRLRVQAELSCPGLRGSSADISDFAGGCGMEGACSMAEASETSGLSGGAAEVLAALRQEKDALIRISVMKDGQLTAGTECPASEISENGVLNAELMVENPELWSDRNPECYCVELELVRGGQVTDSICRTFGFRSFTYDPARGFFVNGVYTKMKGVCLHHDLGALGSAFHKQALERQFRVMREMGTNAIRTSHNPPSPQLLELADRMGMLVIDEAFDMWERPKTEYDYARFFKEWSAKDVASWVRRDRNHPCVVMWSIGNEIGDTHADEHGQELTRYLMGEVHRHDPLHNAAVTIGSNYMMGENGQKCADIVKMAGYNYAARFYEKHHMEHPDWCVYGSETCSTVQSRGIYHFPLRQSILTEDDEQCSSLGNSTTSWGAKDIDQIIWEEKEHPYSMGQFLWTGFDYIGEPTPYHTKNSYFGMVDTAGFPKDAFYIMQAGWVDMQTRPMVHLYPYWDFNPGQLIDLRACTNAPEVELFFLSEAELEERKAQGAQQSREPGDAQQSQKPEGVQEYLGRSLGRQHIDQAHGRTIQANWQLAYEPGVLTAVAYDENGREVARDTKRSFSDAAKITLQADKTVIQADGEDMIFLEIGVEDENGTPVENANNRVKVEVTGAGMLVGLDNGDSTDYEPYQATARRLFSGKLLAMIAGSGEGEITVKVSSPGLESARLQLSARQETEQSYISFYENSDVISGWAALLPENQPENYGWKLPEGEVPVRKLELRSADGYLLTPQKQDGLIVEAVKYPANATYTDLEWRVMNEMGLDITFAALEKLDEQGTKVRITAIGDGDFLLRCGVRNGKDKVQVLSQIEVKTEGFGAFAIDPYEFVSASLYGDSCGELGSGKDKGVSTPHEVPAWMMYRNVDFGSFGADEVTIPVFEFNSDPITFTFWDGVPHQEGSSIVGSGLYHKPTIWDTYQEQTFKLDRRMKGTCDFAIELAGKTNIKGFCFLRSDKAFAQVPVLDNDGIYGDTFTLDQDAVTEIGNNVSLVFRDMDFGERKAAKIHIYGRTPLDHNTIQIRFTGEQGESSMMAEFLHSEEYNWQTFEVADVSGMQTVTFVFLPGCNFDFKMFRFE